MNALSMVNRNGIPAIQSTGITLGTSSAVFSFNKTNFCNPNFSGLILINIVDTFTAPTTAVPIQFTTTGVSGSTIDVTTYNGTALTTATWPGTGVYLTFYDRTANTLQILTTI